MTKRARGVIYYQFYEYNPYSGDPIRRFCSSNQISRAKANYLYEVGAPCRIREISEEEVKHLGPLKLSDPPLW